MSLSTDPLLARVRMLDELNSHLTFRISRMSKLLEVEGAQRLSDTGINLTAYRTMLVINIFKEISVSDLSRIMVIDRAQVSRGASDLIGRGILESRADARSKRKKLLALTPAGEALYAETRATFDTRETELTDALDQNLSALWTSIDRISAYLEAAIEAGSEASDQ